jgi:hypothetical protein
MAKNSLVGLLVRIIAAAILLPIASIGLRDTQFGEIFTPDGLAQDKPPLARIADLVVRKGYKDLKLGAACYQFGLGGRAEDGECKGYQINNDVSDEDVVKYGWQKGWTSSFNTFVERRTGKTRIILADHDASLGYGFLVSPDGELLKAALMRNMNDKEGHWDFTAVAITSDLRAKFEFEKSAWIKAEKEIDELPDRKD